MNSRELTQFGFSGWANVNKAHKGLVLENLPALPGVYAISGPGSSRQIGFSDVLYIGSAANQDGLRLRLRQYYHPGPSQSTNKRINALVMASDSYGLSYAVAPDPESAKRWETALLNRFLQEHGELPAQNRAAAPLATGEVTTLLEQLSAFEQPDWQVGYQRAMCAVCGKSGRMLLEGGNDPFYAGTYLTVCDCREPICDDANCNDEHADC